VGLKVGFERFDLPAAATPALALVFHVVPGLLHRGPMAAQRCAGLA
jgi:hypothetical protein